jgi:hypothetical protein
MNDYFVKEIKGVKWRYRFALWEINAKCIAKLSAFISLYLHKFYLRDLSYLLLFTNPTLRLSLK